MRHKVYDCKQLSSLCQTAWHDVRGVPLTVPALSGLGRSGGSTRVYSPGSLCPRAG